MRKNVPVTKNEIHLKDDQTIISRTDLKGVITYASEDFQTISGYNSGELIGQPHNLVRHPDVPEWIFEDLWKTIQKGKPWVGVVKNRCKNGDYYWVNAEVSPIHRDGKIVSYISNRFKASEEQKKQAMELYKLSENPKKHKLIGLITDLSIRARLYMMVLIMMLLMGAMFGVYALSIQQIIHEIGNNKRITNMSNDVRNALNLMIEARKNTVVESLVGRANPEGIVTLEKSGSGLETIIVKYLKEIPGDVPGIDENQKIRSDLKKETSKLLDALRKQSVADIATQEKSVGDLQSKLLFNLAGLDVAFKEHAVKRIESNKNIYFTGLIVLLSISVIAMLIMVYALSRILFAPIQKVVAFTKKMAEGDLSGKLEVAGNNEISKMLESIKMMQINIRGLTSQILDSAKTSMKTSDKLKEYSKQLTDTAVEQVRFTSETSAAVEELTASSEHIVTVVDVQTENVMANRNRSVGLVKSMTDILDQIKQLKDHAMESTERATVGEATIGLTMAAMEEIKVQSSKIGDIVNLITDISDQTNLLSLNASIEAARAGEGGRGFAVVADEISRLADRTGESVKEIMKLVNLTNDAVQHGSDQFGEAASNFSDINQRVTNINRNILSVRDDVEDMVSRASGIGETTRKVEELAREVQQAATEQKLAMNDMNDNIQMISEKSQYVGLSAEDLAALVEIMSEQAEFLKNMVGQFKVN